MQRGGKTLRINGSIGQQPRPAIFTNTATPRLGAGSKVLAQDQLGHGLLFVTDFSLMDLTNLVYHLGYHSKMWQLKAHYQSSIEPETYLYKGSLAIVQDSWRYDYTPT